METIKVGDYVVVQRQGYTKLHKLKAHGNLILGTFNVQMDNIIGQNYFDTFQMKNVHGNKKLYTLEKVTDIYTALNSVNIERSGIDNRNITSDGESQTLTKDEIDRLKEEEFSSNNIVEQLVSNSKTFNLKTEYSQEKYIKKKEKKYFEYIQIRRPSIRLLTQMFYRQDPSKTLGIRIDDLSQILTYANLQSSGNHLLYDSGTSGLMSAAIMHAIGANTEGHLIHIHPGNECQKNAFFAMQFPQEQADRCINVNLYSVLRNFYQNKQSYCEEETDTSENERSNTEEPILDEPQSKKPKFDEDVTEEPNLDVPQSKKQKVDASVAKKTNWQIENEKACRLLLNKTDSLIVTAKEHPVNIVKELICFLNGNRILVVYSLLKEPLQDLYVYLKKRTDIINIRLSSNFLRNYQVLPERTHPEVNMTTSGFILSAHKLIN